MATSGHERIVVVILQHPTRTARRGCSPSAFPQKAESAMNLHRGRATVPDAVTGKSETEMSQKPPGDSFPLASLAPLGRGFGAYYLVHGISEEINSTVDIY